MNGEIYRELESSAWSHVRPDVCPCRNGWLLSDFDTWHRCRVHGVGVPHPEDVADEVATFDHAKHSLDMWRKAFQDFRGMAVRAGFKGNFKSACMTLMPKGDRTPKAWVDAAEEVADGAVVLRCLDRQRQ